ncbi:MAG: hypothetical protein IPP29_04840 [Bacteroidetes bacterium]|nr:hypothetical protein [Bacteroidota bacterium]
MSYVRNKAIIIFDNNAPIITNETEHVVIDTANVQVQIDTSKSCYLLNVSYLFFATYYPNSTYLWSVTGGNINYNNGYYAPGFF